MAAVADMEADMAHLEEADTEEVFEAVVVEGMRLTEAVMQVLPCPHYSPCELSSSISQEIHGA